MIKSVTITSQSDNQRQCHNGSFTSILNFDTIQKAELAAIAKAQENLVAEAHRDESSLTCADLLEQQAWSVSNKSTVRKVSFQEGDIAQEYENNFSDLHECETLWYTAGDFERFRRLTLRSVNFLRESIMEEANENDDETCWFQIFQQVYMDYIKPPPPSTTGHWLGGLQAQAAANSIWFCDSYVGLERKVMEVVLCEQTIRKDCLYHQSEFWQDMEILDEASKGEMICKISQGLSRPSVGMAFYVANTVAVSVVTNQ